MSMAIEPYGWMQILAVGLFLAVTERRLRRRGRSVIAHPWLIALCVLAAGIGGRLHFAVEAMADGRAGPGAALRLLDPVRGGSTFFGAMAGVLTVLALLRRSLPTGSAARLLDDCVPGLALAILAGRVGCLLQGCCLGAESALPWAVPARLDFPAGAIRHHPLVLYLGVWAVASASLSSRLRPRLAPRAGGEMLAFAALFCAGRAALESLRMTIDPNAIRWAQLESVLIAGAAVAVILAGRAGWGRAGRGRNETPPPDSLTASGGGQNGTKMRPRRVGNPMAS